MPYAALQFRRDRSLLQCIERLLTARPGIGVSLWSLLALSKRSYAWRYTCVERGFPIGRYECYRWFANHVGGLSTRDQVWPICCARP
jgi:hypothetical protein